VKFKEVKLLVDSGIGGVGEIGAENVARLLFSLFHIFPPSFVEVQGIAEKGATKQARTRRGSPVA
jgi:hypothetical protein